MYQIRKSFTFEAAHQLEGAFTAACHECIHGHSYTVEMIVQAEILDENRMVVDFGRLKTFKESVMESWDHGLILHENKESIYLPLIEAGHLKKSKVSFLPENPTAETMAKTVFYNLRDFLHKVLDPVDLHHRRVSIDRIRVHETASGWAEYIENTRLVRT